MIMDKERGLVILQGLPASGKSTMRRELIEKSPCRFAYVNKDELRLANPTLDERNIHALQIDKATDQLQAGFSVIIDNTNLNPRTLESYKKLAESQGVGLITTLAPYAHDWASCIYRDKSPHRLQAGTSVGRSVIIKMAMEAGFYDAPKYKARVFDVDGTLTLVGERRRHVLKTSKHPEADWGSFFKEMVYDGPNKPVVDAYNKYADSTDDGHILICCSGRPENYRRETEEWLEKNVLSMPYLLLMRPTGSHQPDDFVKKQLYEKYIKPFFEVEVVFDDRDAVVKMWRQQGLTCFQVAEGDF